MENYYFENDIVLACKKASKFPDGVQEAFETLHKAIPFTTDRKFISISWMNETREIIYLAGAEVFHGEHFPELELFNCKKGNYRGAVIQDFMKDIPQIGLLFQELFLGKDVDPNGYCLEWYFNEKDVKCMVKLT